VRDLITIRPAKCLAREKKNVRSQLCGAQIVKFVREYVCDVKFKYGAIKCEYSCTCCCELQYVRPDFSDTLVYDGAF
jgi:hypothetical protein